MPETRVQSLDREDPLEKGMATLSSMPARRIPWTEEPGGRCQKDGAQISRTGGLLRRGRENSELSLSLSTQAKGRPVRTQPAGGCRRAGERPQEEPTPGISGLKSWEDSIPVFQRPGRVLCPDGLSGRRHHENRSRDVSLQPTEILE